MDTSQAVTHIGLCAGYGGIELGLHRAIPNLRSVALCEIEAFAIANLVSKMEAGLMDPAPIWPDLKTFPWAAFRDRVDILTGGYPCQPFSAAGQRRGKDDPRHLWPYIADGIRLLRPRCCFFENVEGHISLGLSDVIEDLAGMGYRTTWGIFSASECGAPHQRKRVFILAVASGLGGASGLSGQITGNEGQPGESDDGGGEVMADSSSTGSQGCRGQRKHGEGSREVQAVWSGSHAWPSRPGEQQYGWEPPRVVANTKIGGGEIVDDTKNANDKRREPTMGGTGGNLGGQNQMDPSTLKHRGADGSHWGGQECETQPPLGGDADGSASWLDYAELCVTCDNRTDELRLLGNGVVPATAERAFLTLMRELDTSKAVS
jgi:DNA (cytosine-5)-methyltransferase 1